MLPPYIFRDHPGRQWRKEYSLTNSFRNFVLCAVTALLVTAAPTVRAQANGVATTPPMGWNSWNKFRNKVDDAVVRAQADSMVSSGMRDAGYLYVNIDDTWEGERDSAGNIQSNSKFPDMKALADYVHSK